MVFAEIVGTLSFLQPQADDDISDRLHYYYTTTFLLLTAVSKGFLISIASVCQRDGPRHRPASSLSFLTPKTSHRIKKFGRVELFRDLILDPRQRSPRVPVLESRRPSWT